MKPSGWPVESEKKSNTGRWTNNAVRNLRLHSETAVIEAQAVLAWALGVERASLIAHPERDLSEEERLRADEALEGLLRGVPLAYITGRQEFFGLPFEVNPSVLIPRPETELLVETAIQWLKDHPHARRAADVGTGSGAIAVSLARAVRDLFVLAIDRSRAALDTARRNVKYHAVGQQIGFVQADLLSAASGPYGLVCANLPYVPTETLRGSPVSRHEPLMALDGGPDGLRLVERLLNDSPRWLASGGCLLLEIEYRQGRMSSRLARAVWPDANISILPDLAGLDRFLIVDTAQ